MTKLNLFEGFGLELEYMLVDAETLDVRPVADRLLSTLAGRPTSDVECGDVTWSNELTAHVIELKVTRPVSGLGGLAESFASAVTDLQPALAEMNLRLLPSGMHPWMDPSRETQLWPLEGAEIYQAFDRIFGCRAHGWANVQSTHLNLPFADEDQFATTRCGTIGLALAARLGGQFTGGARDADRPNGQSAAALRSSL